MYAYRSSCMDPYKTNQVTFGTHVFLGHRGLVFSPFGIQNNLEF